MPAGQRPVEGSRDDLGAQLLERRLRRCGVDREGHGERLDRVMGTLELSPGPLPRRPARDRPSSRRSPPGGPVDDVLVAPIDADLADTAAFAPTTTSGWRSRRTASWSPASGGVTRYAAYVVLATTRADVNGVVRRMLDVRKASFAPMAEAVD